MGIKAATFGSVLGFRGEHDPEDHGHRPKDDVAEIDWSGLISIEQDRAYAATNQPTGA
jgi:hypothetical protein